VFFNERPEDKIKDNGTLAYWNAGAAESLLGYLLLDLKDLTYFWVVPDTDQFHYNVQSHPWM